jgi:NAD+ synthase (glutamine-hydrolysing)
MKLRVALAQINPTLGDLVGNADLVARYVGAAQAEGAALVVFPEMVLTGYPVEDLALRPSFRSASILAISELAKRLKADGNGEITAVIGYLDQVADAPNRQGQPVGAPQNAVAIIHNGQIKARYVKQHLPNYGVFDEFRNFVPGTETLLVRVGGIDVGIAICEDLWQDGGLIDALAARMPGLVVVPNGSPFERNKDDVRLALVKKRAIEFNAPLAYVNMTGGQDDLVFDGDSIVVGPDGSVIARAPQFADDLIVLDIAAAGETGKPDLVISEKSDSPVTALAPMITPRLGDEAEIWSALVTGLRDYIYKNKFRSVALGLSGGIDSAVVAAIAVDAIGAKCVNGVALPSQYSSDHSIADAKSFADNTGIHFRIVPIAPMVDAYLNSLTLKGLAEENLQARVRGTALMGISNQEGHLILATGNKSELAVGYSTLYGDAVGGFAPIKDIYKTEVWALAKWRNAKAVADGEVPPIPQNSITKEPSAELRPDQKDSDSLPDYELLDQILWRYVDEDHGITAIIAAGFDAATVARVISMVDTAEYKRRQYPPGAKVSARAFGKDRRLPITSRWREGQ